MSLSRTGVFSAFFFFFFNDPATTEIYTLSLHDALPISSSGGNGRRRAEDFAQRIQASSLRAAPGPTSCAVRFAGRGRSRGHSQPAAHVESIGAEPAGTGAFHRPAAPAGENERGRYRGTVIAQQILGQYAAGTAGRDEPARAGGDFRRSLSHVCLHVHLAAVHASEPDRQAGG